MMVKRTMTKRRKKSLMARFRGSDAICRYGSGLCVHQVKRWQHDLAHVRGLSGYARNRRHR